ncbi:uncharacterized protein LOC116617925 isoform X2 [Nematostella vectensis]|uniref:uncharacterized protein LOC116617925 isoform X2 n=1 Tax=Nematostella vectensis TaxID=45351 RepID=UPI00207794F5|nr:uncharacterized protein LOC116617925 isoform X2 [Nematostella vectensis]
MPRKRRPPPPPIQPAKRPRSARLQARRTGLMVDPPPAVNNTEEIVAPPSAVNNREPTVIPPHATLSPDTLEMIISTVTTRVTDALIPLLPQRVPAEEANTPVEVPPQTRTDALVESAIANVRGLLSASGFQRKSPSNNAFQPDGNSVVSVATTLGPIVETLMASSLQQSSIPTYRRAWRLFNQFLSATFQNCAVQLPISPSMVALFIAYLFDHHYAPSTVHTYVSALGYSHRLSNLPDPTKVFYVIQILKGYSKIGFKLDTRLPITLPILQRLVTAAPVICSTKFESCLFQSMCCFAFYAFLRVGEMTQSSQTQNTGSLLTIFQLSQLKAETGVVKALKLTFHNFKHSYNQRPFSLIIQRQNSPCPVNLLLQYLVLRGTHAGPLFLDSFGNAVTRDKFTNLLSLAIRHSGLNPSFYKGHSFRIGVASHAAAQGLSDAQIRIMGRWKSNAFQKYIRVNSLVN